MPFALTVAKQPITLLCTSVSQSDSWIEVRLQGKLPERRSNHCAFIMSVRNDE